MNVNHSQTYSTFRYQRPAGPPSPDKKVAASAMTESTHLGVDALRQKILFLESQREHGPIVQKELDETRAQLAKVTGQTN